MDNLLDNWSYYDPFGKGKITINDFRFFMCEIEPPFGDDLGLMMNTSLVD